MPLPTAARRAGASRRAHPDAPGPGPLDEYAARRTFAASPEPVPEVPTARPGPLLFVVQQHAARRLHYDLRLELGGVLKSWAVPKGPSQDPDDRRLAVEVEDHPFEYASFEGVIPAGQYGAGQVIVWDCGAYAPEADGATWFHDRAEAERRVADGLAKGKLSVSLRGQKLKGSFALVRTADAKNWLLIKHRDPVEAPAVDDRSVLSGITVAELAQLSAPPRQQAARLAPSGHPEALPHQLSPMLAEVGEAAFRHPDWLFEPKLDGYRVLAFLDAGRVTLRSRNGLDLTPAFPSVAAELAGQAVPGMIPPDMILDGEIVALDAAGRPSFEALQGRAQLKTPREIEAAERTTPALFYCFDLLYFAGLDLRQAPYDQRRRWLGQCLLTSPHVRLVHVEADGLALWPAALAMGFEGVVAKRRDSRYEAGRRSAAWLKIKSTRSAEFVIGGYTQGKGSRAPLGALLLGYWDQDGLRYAGQVGSGFDQATLERLRGQLAALAVPGCPFAETPPRQRATTWVRPERVAEVRFAEWTRDGLLRAPVFLRLREDVAAESVRRVLPAAPAGHDDGGIEAVLGQLDDPRAGFTLAVGEQHIRLTHLDRVYWPASADGPALTKRDLLRYLVRVSPWLLPHLADRPLTLVRMPEGIDGERFYQKHWEPPLPPYARTVAIHSESQGGRQDYLLCNDLASLVWLAQSGSLEFHVWHSRARPGPDAAGRGSDYASSLDALKDSVLNYPDYVVFDIDPYIYSGREAPGAEPEYSRAAFEKAKELAFRLRELLQAMALEPLVKTSGKTGLHVFVAIERSLDFAAVREVCALVGRHLLRRQPGLITLEWGIDKRTGRIFLDCNMNVRGKTLCAAWSPRGLPGAPVSMPLTWAALERAQPLDFTLDRLAAHWPAADPWGEALTRKQSLERVLEQAGG